MVPVAECNIPILIGSSACAENANAAINKNANGLAKNFDRRLDKGRRRDIWQVAWNTNLSNMPPLFPILR
jgi:hypothetical protein